MPAARGIVDDALKLFDAVRVQICADSGAKFGDWWKSGGDDTELSADTEAKLDTFLAFAEANRFAEAGVPRAEEGMRPALDTALAEAGLPTVPWKVVGKQFALSCEYLCKREILSGTITGLRLDSEDNLLLETSSGAIFGKSVHCVFRSAGIWYVSCVSDLPGQPPPLFVKVTEIEFA